MKALTVRQPWAWAIVFGGKDVENRTWLPKYRGPLAIHAAAAASQRGLRSPLVAVARSTYRADRGAHGRDRLRGTGALTLSALIGTVELVHAHRAELGCCESEWAEYEYHAADQRRRVGITHLVLENPVPIEPIPCRGRLGMWPVPDDLAAILTAEDTTHR